MTEGTDTADPRDAYDVGDTTVGSPASAQVPSGPIGFGDDVDRDEWEPDHITGYVKGVGGHYHVPFPVEFPAIPGGDPHGLVALSVRESLHGNTSFTGLYVRSDADNYLLRRYISGDHSTKGETTEDGIGTFLSERDVVWVDEDAVRDVEVPVDDTGAGE